MFMTNGEKMLNDLKDYHGDNSYLVKTNEYSDVCISFLDGSFICISKSVWNHEYVNHEDKELFGLFDEFMCSNTEREDSRKK
jgi:hypothetical protein